MNTFDARNLINAERDVRTPFRLVVRKPGADKVELSYLKVLRLLPRRRIVALAEYEGEQILVKTFLGKSAAKYALRERTGVLAIARAGVRTPELLWEGEFDNGRLLAFRYLPDAVNIEQQWTLSHEPASQTDILIQVTKILAKLHDHGVVQHDIHLDNFLLSEGEINTIDGGAVEQRGEAPLPEKQGLSNLALFFAQLYPRFDVLIDDVFSRYMEYRGWRIIEGRLGQFENEVQRLRESRKLDYINKTFRDCTRFHCRTRFTRYEVCERQAYSAELAELMTTPDRFIEAGELLKDGNSATVALVRLSDRSLVVKRYNIKNPWHGLMKIFRKSRAWQSWKNAHRLEFLGIPALKPVAMIENRIGPLRSSAYLISEFIEGPDASMSLSPDLQGELEAIARILQELSDVQISHGDLKATNFVMTGKGPVMIDLDGMKEHKNQQSFERAFSRDLHRFMENWHDKPQLRSSFSGLLSDLSARHGVSL
jgi:tRNA A-37 threonylcarbamoyl transferase component Bud32